VTIKSPHLQNPLQATPDNIADIMASLPQQNDGDRFAILGGNDPQVYIQTLSTPKGFQLEYQEGRHRAALPLHARRFVGSRGRRGLPRLSRRRHLLEAPV